MNQQTQEALKMAIETFERHGFDEGSRFDEAIQACKEALAQPAQEPVAYADYDRGTCYLIGTPIPVGEISNPLYTHPAPSWQGLSDGEIDSLDRWGDLMSPQDMIDFARDIEQALKEKNSV